MILSLDISTSVTGISILDDAGNLQLSHAIKLNVGKTKLTSYQKLTQVKDCLLALQCYNITDVCIEAPLLAFAGQKSSAFTLSSLQAFNGAVSYICEDIYKIEPEFISATSARKLCGIKIPKGSKAKQVVLEHIKLTDKQFQIEYSKLGNVTPSTYDRLDAYIIAKAYRILHFK